MPYAKQEDRIKYRRDYYARVGFKPSPRMLQCESLLRQLYPTAKKEVMVRRLGYSWGSIRRLACFLHLRGRRRYPKKRQNKEITNCLRCGDLLIFDRYEGLLHCLACGWKTVGRERTCPICLKHFIARIDQVAQRHRICCSKSCAMKWSHLLGRIPKAGTYLKLAKRNCEWCGKLFQPKASDQRFCCISCGARARGAKIKDMLWVWRNCIICGKEFRVRRRVVDRGRGILCSKHCQGVYAARKLWEKKGTLKPKACALCGELFKPHQARQIYCSKKCSTRGNAIEMWQKRKAILVYN